MNKQTKQLLALGVLVLLAGGVAYFWVFRDKAPAPVNKPAPVNAAATPKPTGPAPKPGATTPSAPGSPAPIAKDQDLEIPAVVKVSAPADPWPSPGGRRFVEKRAEGIFAPFDPLMVQNIDVVDPLRRAYIESLKQEWILDGITRTEQEVPITDWSGKQMMGRSITAPRVKTERLVRIHKADDPSTPGVDDTGQPVYDELGKLVIDDVPVMENGKPVYEQATDHRGQLLFDEAGKPIWAQDILYHKLNSDGTPMYVPVLGENGEPLVDAKGKPVYEQELDEKGNPKFDKDNQPVYKIMVIRNPKPEEFVRRLVVQVPVIIKVPVKDANGVPVLDENGNPVVKDEVKKDEAGNTVMKDDDTPQVEIKFIYEAHFQNKRRPYRVKDRLTGTRFTILDIFTNRPYWNDSRTAFSVRSGVDLISDTGAPLTLFMTNDDRYDEEAASKGK